MRVSLLTTLFYGVLDNFNVIRVYALINAANRTYWPDWVDLRTRPLPQWYDNAKIGIFIHWGVYSVPSFKDEWFWFYWRKGNKEVNKFVKENYGDGVEYKDFAPMFTADKFDPEQWAQLLSRFGAKYVVLTAKHHDGFAMFPSGRPDWNSVDVGPKQDIVGNLSKSIRKFGMKFGVYYSLMEWFNDILLTDTKKNTTVYTDTIVWPDIKFLVNNYKPSVLWSDGDSDFSYYFWKSQELLAWIYNESPVKDEIVVNDRWGLSTAALCGDFYNHMDEFNPRILMPHKWENAFRLDCYSWGYRRDVAYYDLLGFIDLLESVVSTVSCGGNALINIGPTKEGIIVPMFQELLLQLGDWLRFNGEAIYNTSPYKYQRDNLSYFVWYTCVKEKLPLKDNNETIQTVKAVYAIFLIWPRHNKLKIADTISELWSDNFHIKFMDPNTTNIVPVEYQIRNGTIEVHLPNLDHGESGWVLKIVAAKNTR